MSEIKKVINYVWLSREPLNYVAKKCIASWRKYEPDYEIRKWTLKDFDMDKMPDFVHEAIRKKKWAFACDYLRLWILYNEGGVYFDSDVLLCDNIDSFLNHNFVSAIECFEKDFIKNLKYIDENGQTSKKEIEGFGIQAAFMASIPKHPFVKACLDYYEGIPFVYENGNCNNTMVMPHVLAYVAKPFGFVYKDKPQLLSEDTILYPSSVFAPHTTYRTKLTVAVHICNGSWRDLSTKQKWQLKKMKKSEINKISQDDVI